MGVRSSVNGPLRDGIFPFAFLGEKSLIAAGTMQMSSLRLPAIAAKSAVVSKRLAGR